MDIFRVSARILVMTVATEISLCLVGAGFDPQGWLEVGGFVVLIGTVPIMLCMAILVGLERLIGRAGPVVIGCLGLLPALFILQTGGPSEIQGGYGFAIILAGVLWGTVWAATTLARVRPPLQPD